MDIEKLKKKMHPDSNPALKGHQALAWYLIVFIPFLFFMALVAISLWSFFTNNSNDSTNLSNIGFGTLIALSSVCFSYFKVIQPNDYIRLHHDVQKCGELFLASAVAFIISSVLKYSSTVIEPDSFISRFAFVIKCSFKFTFAIAEVICIAGLALLIDVLFIRLTTKRK